jgi:hypothetical protein
MARASVNFHFPTHTVISTANPTLLYCRSAMRNLQIRRGSDMGFVHSVTSSDVLRCESSSPCYVDCAQPVFSEVFHGKCFPPPKKNASQDHEFSSPFSTPLSIHMYQHSCTLHRCIEMCFPGSVSFIFPNDAKQIKRKNINETSLMKFMAKKCN